MGMFKGAEAAGPLTDLVEAARIARAEGRNVFVGRLVGGVRTDAADLWARTIEAIESEGWQLEKWAVGEHFGWPVFRRR